MSWADKAIASLALGDLAVIHPRGHSMTGKVNDGQTVMLEPAIESK